MQNLKFTSGWIPLFAGLILLLFAADAGYSGILLLVLPAVLLVAGGARSLLFTDLRAPQMAAVGAVLGVLLAIPFGLLHGIGPWFAALLACLAGFVAAGWFHLRVQPQIDEVPAPAPGPVYSTLVALDDAMLGAMAAITPAATPAAWREAVAESEAAYDLLRAAGCLEQPRLFHTPPPALSTPELRPVTVQGHRCEEVRFASEFEPMAGLPGRERWLGYAENRTAHALLLRQPGPAPWLVCVHGFGMGNPANDFRAFRAAKLHAQAGVNVALFVMPVHGPRSPGGFNGEKFFGVSLLDQINAVTHAVWDLRRLIGWLRAEGATGVGVFGISLGGYTSAVLGGLEDDLDCVIAGIPPTDLIAHREYLAGGQERRMAAIAGVDAARDRAVHSVVAPLQLPSLVAPEGRYLFAATGDQFVPIEQVHALWLHWSRPRIAWVTGGHLSAILQRAPRELVDEALRKTFPPRG